MALTMTIAAVDRSAFLMPNSLTYEDVLNGRSTMRFRLLDLQGGFAPADGQEVLFKDGATTLLAGMLVEPEEEVLSGALLRNIECEVEGYGQICARHLVARVYENLRTDEIVTDILTQDLAGEGITAGSFDAGPTVTKIVFNYRSVVRAFDELAELSGFSWCIDVAKVLQFRQRVSVTFGTTITKSNARWMRVKPSRARYRNRQLIRAGVDLTSSRTESFAGDTKRRTWTLRFPVGKEPTSITVDTGGGPVAKTIGIGGVDNGKDFYWNKSQTEVSQDDAGTLLVATDTLAITYQGEFPIIVQADRDNDIAARKTIEGGTGLYEHVLDDPNIDDDVVAVDKAVALLDRSRLRSSGGFRRIIRFETALTGIQVGMVVPINVSEFGLNNTFLVDRLQVRDSQGQRLWYVVTALEAEATGGWQEFYRRMIQAMTEGNQKIVLRENEVILLLRTFNENVVDGDSLVHVDAAPDTTVGVAKVGFSEVA